MLDCDGTLFDSFDANVGFYDAVLAQVGRPPLDEAGRELGHRLSTPQILQHLFAEEPETLARATLAARSTDYAPFLARMRPMPDLFETLDWLRANYRTALVTNRGGTIPALLAHFDLGRYFDAVVGVHDAPRPKPAPDMLLRCLDQLGTAAERSIYVGDSPSDLEAAHAAGVPFIAFGEALSCEPRIFALAELRELLAP
jgi:HAD superfamily hydrolase (TIGR01509 family)